MIIDKQTIESMILHKKIDKPAGGLAGHATGSPFEKIVYDKMKERYPKKVFRQYEYLNHLFKNNPNAITYDERVKLFNSDLMAFLLKRGRKCIENWTTRTMFKEKQGDTADIVFCGDNNYIEIIDVKTKNESISGQAPNIISAYKLAQAMQLMLKTKEYDKIDIVYIEVGWKQVGNKLVIDEVHTASIFKSDPEKLYINWSAALQIQFHVSELPQSFSGTKEDWAKKYLNSFYHKALERAKAIRKKFADPFKEYANDSEDNSNAADKKEDQAH